MIGNMVLIGLGGVLAIINVFYVYNFVGLIASIYLFILGTFGFTKELILFGINKGLIHFGKSKGVW
jgi:hypothetical protein